MSIAWFLLDGFLVTVGDRLRDGGRGLVGPALLAETGHRQYQLGRDPLGELGRRPAAAAFARTTDVVALLVIVGDATAAVAPETGAAGASAVADGICVGVAIRVSSFGGSSFPEVTGMIVQL
jgi:hypothetical protein